MNILFLSTRSPYPLISGHSLRTYHILKGAAREHNVFLVTFVQLEDELRKENLEHLRGFCQAVYPFSIPVDISKYKLAASLLANIVSPLPFVAQKYDNPSMRQKIREILITDRIDLIHVDMLPLTVYIDEFGQLPKLLANHNVESVRLYRWFKTEPNPLKKVYLGIQWLKLRSFERSAMSQFDCCVVVSEIDKHLLLSMGVKNELFVVPNGTDTKFFRPGGKVTRENSVLWIGHMDVHTNRDAVLYFWREIFPIMRKEWPRVCVTFVGTAPPQEIVDATRMDSNVQVTGFVDDIRPYVNEAAVIVVPIRIGSGTRIKILDTMAMGKAVVSTSVGCEGLNIADETNILIADAPEDFAYKSIKLLKNEKLRKELEREARKLAQTYNWETISARQEEIYRHVLEGRN